MISPGNDYRRKHKEQGSLLSGVLLENQIAEFHNLNCFRLPAWFLIYNSHLQAGTEVWILEITNTRANRILILVPVRLH